MPVKDKIINVLHRPYLLDGVGAEQRIVLMSLQKIENNCLSNIQLQEAMESSTFPDNIDVIKNFTN